MAAFALFAAACSSPIDPGRDASARQFTGCEQAKCTGTLDNGDSYQIQLPKVWNGTLLLYSHGYRPAAPLPPSYRPASTNPDVAPDTDVAKHLLDSGYALVGYAQHRNGWTIRDSMDGADRLYALFRSQIGVPARVYTWGESIGGLVSELLAEQRSWVSGTAPFCGLLAGTNHNQDLALDAAWAVKVLLYPNARLTGYRSAEVARDTYEEAARRVRAAADAGGTQLAKVLLAGALVQTPEQSEDEDGSTTPSRARAVEVNLLGALAVGIIGRPDLEERAGGNPSSNTASDYDARVPDLKRAEIAHLASTSLGTVNALMTQVDAAPRVAAAPSARAAADRLGNPTGALRVPTITLHTTVDSLAVPNNERLFADLVARDRTRRADLLQLFTQPPARYPDAAPYAAGTCAFTTWEQVGTIIALDRWVKTGDQPALPELGAMLAGPDRKTGFIPLYQPQPWPALR